MNEIAAGAWCLPLLGVNVYLLETEDGPVLVDAGTPWQATTIVRKLRRHGIVPDELRAILITHGDFDHVGGLAHVAREMRAPVYVPADEVDVVMGDRSPRPIIVGSRLATAAGTLFERFVNVVDRRPVDIAGTLQEAEPARGGLTVIDTPGHTIGHVCLLDEARSVLIGGDLLVVGRDGRIQPPFVLGDEHLHEASLEKIRQYDFDCAGFGHGPPLTANAAIHVRAGITALER